MLNTIEVVHAINAVHHRWDLFGLLDDRSELHGKEILGFPVLGSVDTASQYDDSDFVVSTGTEYDYFSRKHIVQRLGLPSQRFHPSPAECSSLLPSPHILLPALVRLPRPPPKLLPSQFMSSLVSSMASKGTMW
jgi:hypothetical protein